MNTKHTPGPWEFAEAGCGGKDGNFVVDEIFVRKIGDDVAIAEQIIDPNTCKPSLSNARLIAAVPELLEALIEIYSLRPIGSGASEYSLVVEQIARAAIAKATGA